MLKKSKKILYLITLVGVLIVFILLIHTRKLYGNVKNNENSNQGISKNDVITWINEQSSNKPENFDEFEYKVIDIDNDSNLEIIAQNSRGVHLGTFYIFDNDKNGNYKLIAEKNWNISSWDFYNPIIIDNKKIYKVVDRSGGTGIDTYTVYLWYLENGKFIEAWNGLVKSRSVFADDYQLRIGSYQFNDENNLLYTWLSNYVYKSDGLTLKEKRKDDIKVFKFNGVKFIDNTN